MSLEDAVESGLRPRARLVALDPHRLEAGERGQDVTRAEGANHVSVARHERRIARRRTASSAESVELVGVPLVLTQPHAELGDVLGAIEAKDGELRRVSRVALAIKPVLKLAFGTGRWGMWHVTHPLPPP
jgi:hypothetical protein